jgi:PAS domain S-box-containing protein
MKGKIPDEMLAAVLDALPAELTLTDSNDKIIAWTEAAYKIFHRSDEILGTDVLDCHSEKSRERVGQLLADLKSGKKDKETMVVPCKDEKTGEPIKVRIDYVAVRSAEGEYLGCLEVCRLVDEG